MVSKEIRQISKIASSIMKYLFWIMSTVVIHEEAKLQSQVIADFTLANTMKDQSILWLIVVCGILIAVNKFITFVLKLTENGNKTLCEWDKCTICWDIISDLTDLASLCLQVIVAWKFNLNHQNDKDPNKLTYVKTQVQVAVSCCALIFKFMQRLIKWIGMILRECCNKRNSWWIHDDPYKIS